MLRIGLVGAGQIARVQHIPAIAAAQGLELVAIANPFPVAVPDGVSLHGSLTDMLADGPAIDAVALCTPPQVRYELAIQALDAGKHVLLEKPPATTPAEIISLAAHAAKLDLTLFTAWHSLFSAGVDRAREILARRQVTVAGAPVQLSPREYDLLSLLVRNAGRVMTHRQLLTAVWGPAHVEDVQYLRVYVGHLRQKLGPANMGLIATEPGVGYRLTEPSG